MASRIQHKPIAFAWARAQGRRYCHLALQVAARGLRSTWKRIRRVGHEIDLGFSYVHQAWRRDDIDRRLCALRKERKQRHVKA